EVSAGTCGAGTRGHRFDVTILLSPSGRERLPAPSTKLSGCPPDSRRRATDPSPRAEGQFTQVAVLCRLVHKPAPPRLWPTGRCLRSPRHTTFATLIRPLLGRLLAFLPCT